MTAAAPSIVVCLRDGAELVEVERDGVMIDACPTCRGIRLDRGELEKLIAHENAGAADNDFLQEVTGRQTSDEQDDEDDRSQSGGKRRRGGFLENFLDFEATRKAAGATGPA